MIDNPLTETNITRGGRPYQIDEDIEWIGGECELLDLDGCRLVI